MEGAVRDRISCSIFDHGVQETPSSGEARAPFAAPLITLYGPASRLENGVGKPYFGPDIPGSRPWRPVDNHWGGNLLHSMWAQVGFKVCFSAMVEMLSNFGSPAKQT